MLAGLAPGTVIRPSPYVYRVAGQFRDSGLVSWMTAVGHGVTALGRGVWIGAGEGRRAGDGG